MTCCAGLGSEGAGPVATRLATWGRLEGAATADTAADTATDTAISQEKVGGKGAAAGRKTGMKNADMMTAACGMMVDKKQGVVRGEVESGCMC